MAKKKGSKGGYGPASRNIPKQPTPHNPSSKSTTKY
jgi:hypothetical protein